MLTCKPDLKVKELIENIKIEQEKDPALNRLRQRCMNDGKFRDFSFNNGILFKDHKIILPNHVFNILIIETLELYAHLGTKKV